MSLLTHRLEVLLDEERYTRLARLAQRRDTSVAELVRAALDRAYPSDQLTRSEAAQRLLDRDPLEDLGSWDDVKFDIESGLARRWPE